MKDCGDEKSPQSFCCHWLTVDKDKTPDKRLNSVFLRLVVLARRQPCVVRRTEKSSNFSLFQVRSSFAIQNHFLLIDSMP